MHNLEDLFHDADDRLLEMPSSRAWSKLENRLESRISERDRERVRLKGQFTRQMSVAAAVLATVLVAGIWATMHLLPMNTDRMAQGNVTHFSPTMQENKSENAAIVTENTPLKPIENATDNRFIQKDAKQPRIETITTAGIAQSSNEKVEIKTNKITVAEMPPQAVTTIAPAPIAKAAAPTLSYKDADIDGIDDKYAAETKMITRKSTAVKPSISAKIPQKAIESAMNSVPRGESIVKQAMLTDLAWLTGRWNNQDKSFVSSTNWHLDGRFTLYGESFVRINGDSTHTETIKIQQEGNLLALYIPIDASGKIFRYELNDREPSAWTFVNREIPFPQTIALLRKDRNRFEIVMSGGAPIRDNTAQYNYLRQHNSLFQERVTRLMER
jgi:hypothetical protein